jgi:hypothetical protein
LNRFIEENLYEVSWKEIVNAERAAFHVCYLDQFQSPTDFKSRALAKKSHVRIGIDDRRQEKFEFYLEGREQYKA